MGDEVALEINAEATKEAAREAGIKEAADIMITSKYKHAAALLVSALMILFLPGRDAMAVPEAQYTVIEKEGDFELREYDPVIFAETIVEGDFAVVGNVGFRRLFDYINGKNRKRGYIPMTAPVLEETASEKIRMTAPVNQRIENGKWVISFVMPARYTLETLPEPLDPRVYLRVVPGRLVAALKYSGTWSKDRYDANRAQLEAIVDSHGLRPAGEPVFARYNPPWTLWFLRRNEILIPVEKSGQ